MNDRGSKNAADSSCNWGCVGFIVIIILAYWAIHSIYDKYRSNEKKPFWNGTSQVQVCKKPYYSSGDCYKLNVTLSEDKKTATIKFPNGGYKISYDLTCYFAARFNNTPDYVFCRSWDDSDQQWDFMPIWVNY
jgi:hypothetical protein